MEIQEYLLRYGVLGDFGRFRPTRPLALKRGEQAVIQTPRGLEIGEVLCPATPRHARFLPNTTVGVLVRPLTSADEPTVQQLTSLSQNIHEESRRRVADLALPLEILDVEVLFDRAQAVLHHVRWQDCEVRPLVSGLSTTFEIQILLHDLTRVAQDHPEHEEHGCGSCGSEGGCGSGSCSTGGCGSCGDASAEDLRAYFAELRLKMEQERFPLL